MNIAMEIGKYALVMFALANVAFALAKHGRDLSFAKLIYRKCTVGVFAECIAVVMLTLGTVVLLFTYVPGMWWGWLHLFTEQGGNALISPVFETSESSFSIIRLIPILFLAGLFIVMPYIVKIEEEIFREGHYDWTSITKQSVKFGLVHCIVGVPISAGVALIIPGFFYASKYRAAYRKHRKINNDQTARQHALIHSTVYHTAYNTVIVMILLMCSLALFLIEPTSAG